MVRSRSAALTAPPPHPGRAAAPPRNVRAAAGVRPRCGGAFRDSAFEQVPLHVQLQQPFSRGAPRRVGLVARRREGRAVAGEKGVGAPASRGAAGSGPTWGGR